MLLDQVPCSHLWESHLFVTLMVFQLSLTMQYFGFQRKGNVRFPMQYISLIYIIIKWDPWESSLSLDSYISVWTGAHIHLLWVCSESKASEYIWPTVYLLNRGQAHTRYVKHVPYVTGAEWFCCTHSKLSLPGMHWPHCLCTCGLDLSIYSCHLPGHLSCQITIGLTS